MNDQENKNYDEWAKCYKDKTFPLGLVFTYPQWRRVWEFWYNNKELHDLPIRLVVSAYIKRVGIINNK